MQSKRPVTREQLLEKDSCLKPGQMGPDTIVYTMTEAHVGVWIPINQKVTWLRKHGFVAVSGCEVNYYLIARLNWLAEQIPIRGRGAAHLDNG